MYVGMADGRGLTENKFGRLHRLLQTKTTRVLITIPCTLTTLQLARAVAVFVLPSLLRPESPRWNHTRAMRRGRNPSQKINPPLE